ncbi:MAG: outer membrane beta-barrel protein [Alphaproteobacteria bacterium]
MIKKILLVSSIAALSMTANAEHKNGFYAGAGLVGVKPAAAKARIMATNLAGGTNIGNGTGKLSNPFSVSGRLLGGYHHKWSDMFTETELYVQSNDRDQKVTVPVINTPAGLPVSTGGAVIKLRRNFTLGGALKAGYYATDNLGIFLSTGLLYSQFQTRMQGASQDAVKTAQKQNVWGASIGGGIINHLSNSWLLKAEYAYEGYKKIKTKSLQSEYNLGVGENELESLNTKIRYHSVALSLSYIF